MAAAAAAVAAIHQKRPDLDFSAIRRVLIVVAMLVAVPHSMQQHRSLVATNCQPSQYCIRVLLATVAIALNFHLLNDLLGLPAVNDCRPFDCIAVVVGVVVVYWLDSVHRCHYSNGHFVNWM